MFLLAMSCRSLVECAEQIETDRDIRLVRAFKADLGHIRQVDPSRVGQHHRKALAIDEGNGESDAFVQLSQR